MIRWLLTLISLTTMIAAAVGLFGAGSPSEVFAQTDSAPDLAVPFVYTVTNPFVYDPSFTLAVTVENQGSGSSSSTTLRYYRSADSTITNGDTEVGTDAVGSLVASGRSRESIALTAPSAPGTYYYGACVDAVSDESDTTNNCSWSIAFTVPAETSTDATLSALTLSDVEFGTFASGTTSYRASVANSVTRTAVRPILNDSRASYEIKLGGVTDADGTISLAVGSNVITVEVTAEDEQTTKTYTVTVTREEPDIPEHLSNDATLSALTLSDVDFGTFASATESYTASVANSVSQTSVTPTVNHSAASYVVKLGGVTDADGTISLAVGSNVITIEVTAEDDSTTKTYTVTITRATPLSSDATLSALTLSDVDFGTFSSGTTSYSASVANSVTRTTVTPTVNHSAASYVIKLGGVTDADGTISLAVGSNVITIEVTAENDSTTKTYTVTITRAAPLSSDATLSALTLTDVDFGTFAAGTTSYSASVANSVTRTTVTPTVNHSAASYVVKLGGVTDADGTISLAVGSNVITIEVTAEDDSTTKTYTVTVTRAANSISVPDLAVPSVYTVTNPFVYSPSFTLGVTVENQGSGSSGSTTLRYYRSADSTITSGDTEVGTDAVDGLAESGSSMESIDLTAPSVPGTYYYGACVDAVSDESDTTNNCSRGIAFTVPAETSTDATLSALTLSDVDFGTFASGTLSYTAEVTDNPTETTVTPTVNNSGAIYVIKLGGVTDADGTISLAAGSNVITVEVTAEDEQTTRTYTVTVTRLVSSESNLPSTDATLRGLTLSGIDFGTFASATESYTASVANSVSQTTVTPTVSDDGANYVIKIGGIADADGTVSLAVGSNVIAIEVTAENEQTTRTYTVTVTRSTLPSTVATLAALTLSGIDIGTFAPGITSYSAQVANSVSSTTVTPTVSNASATYVVKIGGVADADGTVTLAVGSNVITIEVTAQDEETTRTYTITVSRASENEQPPRSDAPVTGELPTDDPKVDFRVSGFAHDWVGIAWSVPRYRNITKYVVQRYEHDGDGFVSSGSGEGSRFEGTTKGGDEHSLRNTHVEPDTLYQYVLALKNDGDTTIIETSTAVRTLSSDATLSALALSSIDFGAFDPATTSYTADITNDVTETTVTPTLNHTGASFAVELDGVGDEDGAIDLAVGENVISVVVTAEEGVTTKTYTVTVTRAEQPSLIVGELSSDDPPVNFRITGYSDDQVSLAWEIPNNRGITGYALARYGHDGTEFVISDWSISGRVAGGASATESNTGLTSNTLYKYDLVLKSDSEADIIEKSLEVRTLETGATALSANASLSAMLLSGVELDEDFNSSTYRYTGSVANGVTQSTVTATPNDPPASYVVKLGGAVDEDGEIDLTPGRNVITVHVTAEDGVTTRIYTAVITRAKTADALSSDATLRSLSLRGIDFGTFGPDTTSFTADVTNDVTQTTVTPVRNDVEAAHVIKLGGMEDTDGVIDLAVGANVITVEVTAEDGETTRTYTVTVTRAEAPAPEPADTCVQSVDADGTTEGSWDDTCLSEKDAPGGAGDRYARFYTFTLTEATDVVISLNSEEDTYLYLLDGHGKSGDTLHSNDDMASGGVNLNSRLFVTLQPGAYTIEATTYYAEREGDFTLTIEGLGESEEPAPAPQPDPEPEPEVDSCVESITVDGTIEGSWDGTCLSDRAALSGTGDRHSRFYTFTLDEAADVTITLESDEDTYLYLLEGHGRSVTVLQEEDDIDYPSNTNSRLAETLQSGDYTIEATTYYADKSGEFTLNISGLDSTQ